MAGVRQAELRPRRPRARQRLRLLRLSARAGLRPHRQAIQADQQARQAAPPAVHSKQAGRDRERILPGLRRQQDQATKSAEAEDMKFFKGGVKKWIVAYHSWAYQCDGCGARFHPKEWLPGRSLYQPGLASWCVYQNVECRQTMYQVKDTLADLFGLHVPPRQLYLFKSWIAKRYESLHEEIRRSIL